MKSSGLSGFISAREIDTAHEFYRPDWPTNLAESAIPRVHQLANIRDSLPRVIQRVEEASAKILADEDLSQTAKVNRVSAALIEAQSELDRAAELVSETVARAAGERAALAASPIVTHDAVTNQRQQEIRSWLLGLREDQRVSIMLDVLRTEDREIMSAVASAPSALLRGALIPSTLAQTFTEKVPGLLHPAASHEADTLEQAAGIAAEVVASARRRLAQRAGELSERLKADVRPPTPPSFVMS